MNRSDNRRLRRPQWQRWSLAAGMLLAMAALAALSGCGAASSTNGAASQAHSPNGPGGTTTGQTLYGPNDSAASTPGAGQSNSKGPQYLIKALAVSMTFSDTRKVASDLQTWIATADPYSTSAGSDYQQIGDNQYRITITFSVAASAYPQIYGYLAGYAQTNGGHLRRWGSDMRA